MEGWRMSDDALPIKKRQNDDGGTRILAIAGSVAASPGRLIVAIILVER
jgi:hypothetical protein